MERFRKRGANDAMRFIYVFDDKSKCALLEHGYSLIKESADKQIAVFENKDEQNYCAMPECKCVFSNVLTF